MALGLMAVLGFVSLLISRGLRGNSWAMGLSVALAALVAAFAAYALAFGMIYLLSKIWKRSSYPQSSATAHVTSSAASETPALGNRSDL